MVPRGGPPKEGGEEGNGKGGRRAQWGSHGELGLRHDCPKENEKSWPKLAVGIFILSHWRGKLSRPYQNGGSSTRNLGLQWPELTMIVPPQAARGMKVTNGAPGEGIKFIGVRVERTPEESKAESAQEMEESKAESAKEIEERAMQAELAEKRKEEEAAQREKERSAGGGEGESKVGDVAMADPSSLSGDAMAPMDRSLMSPEASAALDRIKGYPPTTDELSGMWSGLKVHMTPSEMASQGATTASLCGTSADVCHTTPSCNPWDPDNKFSYVARLAMAKNLYDGAKTQVGCSAWALARETERRHAADARLAEELHKDKCKGEVEKAVEAGVRLCGQEVLGDGDTNLAVYQHSRVALSEPGMRLDPEIKGQLRMMLLGGDEEIEAAEETEFHSNFPQFIPQDADGNLVDNDGNLIGLPGGEKKITSKKQAAKEAVRRQLEHEAPFVEDGIRLGQMQRMATHCVQTIDAMILKEDCDGRKDAKAVRGMCMGLLLDALEDKQVTFNGLDPDRFKEYQAAKACLLYTSPSPRDS